MKYRLAVLFAVLLLSACGSRETEIAVDEETDGITIAVEDEETLSFVDAHGNTYVMKVDPDVPANPYDPDAFVRDGMLLSYEDDEYTSRPGVDVSYYQGEIDWEQVKAAGMEFAILRIGYRGYGTAGTLNIDAKFYDNIEGAQKAGLDVGVYFFSQAVDEEEAAEEAEFVIDALDGYELELPVVFDPEHISDSDARTDTVSGKQFTRNAAVFCEAIEEAGYEAMVYSNMVWEAYWLDLKELKEYPVWYADYEPLPQTPYAFSFWQYTESGSVDGISGNVDLNVQMMKKK
ncbi:MAG: glycoside hydrolase family 25 protein [Clostridiales bacterium]|nr:glycoside hydrolase family 25 protein [Clostridiales bacterium]